MQASTDPQLDPQGKRTGLLAWFAQNHVAANLVMIFVIVVGLFSLSRIRIEFFPRLDVNYVLVQVPYLGATPREVETAICQRLEEAVREVDFIKQMRSIAMEGNATVIIEFERDTDMSRALDDVKSAVDRITTFPKEAEEPMVTQAVDRHQVVTLALSGDVPRRTLKELAEQIRDELTTGEVEQMVAPTRTGWQQLIAKIRPPKGISTVTIDGLPPYEISIDVTEQALRRYGLTFDQVSQAVSRSSLDLPGGTVKSAGGDILVRTTGQLYRGHDFEQIVVVTRPDGTTLRLGDVATVSDDFEETDQAFRIDGEPAVALHVYRVGDQDTLEISRTIKKYIELRNQTLPEGTNLYLLIDNSELLKDRISLLLRNAAIGLTLVFIILACFLDLRLAMWTTVGIPMSFLGAFIILPQADVSVNMISLFAFIVVLGIVVDDAIVVGENIFSYRQQPGIRPIDAAIKGVKEIAGPVTMAVLTTMAAFVPLLQGEGVWFQVLRNIPLVVISVLIISTIEAFLVLPSHLSAGRHGGHGGPIARFQSLVRRGLQWFNSTVYRPVLLTAIRWRYVTVAIGMAMLMMAWGLIGGGHLPSEFFPSVEADNMVVAVTMAQGTPVETTAEVVKRIEQAAYQVQREFEATRPEGATPLFKHVAASLGGHPMSVEMTARGGGAPEIRAGGHLGEVNVVLLSGEEREVSTEDLIARWRELVGDITGATAVDFAGTYFASDAVNVELSHHDHHQLVQSVEALKNRLATYEGLAEISDNFVEGKPQVEITGITPRGRAAGIRKEDVARQVRQALYGAEAQRIQRGRDEVKVMVRYPRHERSSLGDLENLRVRLNGGMEVPFSDVAELKYSHDFAVIYRTDRQRTVAVVADINKGVANTQVINNDLRHNVLPELVRKYPGLTWDMEGEQKERNEAMGSLKSNFILALLAIYALLAVQFRSYVQPMIVMVAIPFGIVGAVLGHFTAPLLKMPFTGAYAVMPISFMSFFGIVALTGVVVNDALIMIDLINRERAAGGNLDDVLEHSGTRRFRPILLTTLTTFFGLMPMIMETSLQAQFLIPMAVSLGFGVMFATSITLLLVPSLCRVLEDFKALVGGGQKDR